MAHFIRLHSKDTGIEALYNLDTVVSIDPLPDGGSAITTRWGQTTVKEDLDQVSKLINNEDLSGPQLIEENF